jgi:hypothetical protein
MREHVVKLEEVVVALVARRKSETAREARPATATVAPPADQAMGHSSKGEGLLRPAGGRNGSGRPCNSGIFAA